MKLDGIRYVFVLLLAGCASTASDWKHPTKDASQWKIDAAECERFFGASDSEIRRCMTTKGWRRK